MRGVGFVAQVGASTAQIRRLDPGDPEPDRDYQLISASPAYLKLEGATALGPPTTALLDGRGGVADTAVVGRAVQTGLDLPHPGPGSSLWINGRRVSVIGELRAGSRLPQLDDTIVVSPTSSRATRR